MKDRIRQISTHPASAPVAAGVLSLLGGLGVGYILGKRRREIVFVDIPKIADTLEPDGIVEEEPELIVRPPKVVLDVDDYLERRVNDMKVPVSSLGETTELEDEDEVEVDFPDVISSTVFAQGDDDWDQASEEAKRVSTEPYILHKDEFYANESGLDQLTLTYYAGDDILTDEADSPLYNHEQIVGPLKFGHGSGGDPNIFFVRNEKNKAEYEILRHTGRYSEEVLGIEIENNERAKDLRHSNSPGRFRDD